MTFSGSGRRVASCSAHREDPSIHLFKGFRQLRLVCLPHQPGSSLVTIFITLKSPLLRSLIDQIRGCRGYLQLKQTQAVRAGRVGGNVAALRRYNSRRMAERNQHGIDCRNKASDAHEIQIPSPKLLEEFLARSGKRRQIVAANLLCPHCKHVFDYTVRDVHPLYLTAGPRKSDPVCVAVQFLTGDGGCKSKLTVHVIKKYKNEEPSTAILRLASAIFHIRCEFGHIPRFDYRNVVHAERTRQFFPF